MRDAAAALLLLSRISSPLGGSTRSRSRHCAPRPLLVEVGTLSLRSMASLLPQTSRRLAGARARLLHPRPRPRRLLLAMTSPPTSL